MHTVLCVRTNTRKTKENRKPNFYVRIDDCKCRRLTGTFVFLTKTLLVNSAFLAISLKFSFVSLKYSRRSCDDLANDRD